MDSPGPDRRLEVEGSIVHIMKALASYPAASQSLIEDKSLQLLFEMVANGSLILFSRWRQRNITYKSKCTLRKDQNGDLPNSWSVPEPSLFQIRGENYYKDHKKVAAKSTLMQTIAVDWLRSDKREDNFAARPDSIVQKFASHGCLGFFFVVNFQDYYCPRLA